MQQFLRGKWKALEQRRKIAETYGDNGHLEPRDVKNSPPATQVTSSFDHLLNKTFPVKQIDWSKMYTSVKVINTFRITDGEREKLRARTTKTGV